MDGNILNAFATLSLVVVALGVFLFILKKTALAKTAKEQILDMKVLSKMQLNPKNHLYVVQAGDKRLLLGVSETGITSLSELSNVSSVAENVSVPAFSSPKIVTSKPKTIDNSLSFKSFLKSTFSVGAN
jgi:flagellar biogenesis protein FliO